MLHLPDPSTPAMSICVRSMEPSDVQAVARLHRNACTERLAHRGGAVLVAEVERGGTDSAVEASFRADIDDEGVRVLVAGFDAGDQDPGGPTEPLGHLVVRLAPHEDRIPAVALVEELYVSPEARTVGLGSALLGRARQVATDAGCTGLDAVALPGDRSTKNFFEDHAMVARAIIVHTELGAHTPDGD